VKLRKMFSDIVRDENVLEINSGRAGFAFVRILGRENADRAVDLLHHSEYAPKFRMNVCIGKPPSEYRKQKFDARNKRLNKVNETQPRKTAKKREWQVREKKANNGNEGNGSEHGSDHESDADGVEMGNGPAQQMSQEDIDAFMDSLVPSSTGADSGTGPDPAGVVPPNGHQEHPPPTDESEAGKSRAMQVDNDAEDARMVDQLDALEVELPRNGRASEGASAQNGAADH